jgi:hypothetical protein
MITIIILFIYLATAALLLFSQYRANLNDALCSLIGSNAEREKGATSPFSLLPSPFRSQTLSY